MNEKEKRILILTGDRDELCDLLDKCPTDVPCSKCDASIPRAEAVERMAAAMCMRANSIFDCKDCLSAAKGDCEIRAYYNIAEAALDALIGVEK